LVPFLIPTREGNGNLALSCFEYRGKTRRLGNELGELEAEHILKAICQWDPRLVYTPTELPIDAFPDVPSKPGTRSRAMIGAGPNPIVLLLFGLWILWGFGFETVAARLNMQVEGVVTAAHDIPEERGPRYTTEYILRGSDGQDLVYVAGPTDASLPRSMPVGTHLKKQRWRLYYERNEQRVDDFPVFFYQVTLGIALVCVAWSVVLWRARRHGT
jgi:hypothetical protein